MRKDNVTQTLTELAEQTRPPDAFAARLEANLLARWPRRDPAAQILQPHLGRQAMFKRWAWAITLVVVVMGVIALQPWRQGDEELPLLPRLVSAAGGGATIQEGLLSGAELMLEVTLPSAPGRAPVYRMTSALPATPDAALAWARDFGLPDPQVYRDPREPGALFVVGSDGRRLAFRADGPTASVHYTDDGATGSKSVTSFAEARDVAVTFLRQQHLLPAVYRVEEEPALTQAEKQAWTITLVVELDGQPLIGDMTLIRVVVNAAGGVTYANVPLATFEKLQGYPIQTAQEAWDALLSGGAFRLDTEQAPPAGDAIRTYTRPAPARAVGDAVTVSGWVQVLTPEGDAPVWAQMMTLEGTRYLLRDIPRAADLARIGFNDIQVSGTLVERLGADAWRLAVQQWEIVTDAAPQQSLVGTLQRDGDAAWLVDDAGARYPLPAAPAALEDGARIEATVQAAPAPEKPLDWVSLNTPPFAESHAVHSIGSTVSVVVQPEADGETPAPESPFTLGQTVAVTGVVRATLLQENGREWLEAVLVQIPGVEHAYPLTGTGAMLQELAQLNRLHARLQGQIVPATAPWSFHGQAIEVTSLVQLWPEEQYYTYLGSVAPETLEGQSVAVFTECSSGQRYVMGRDAPWEYQSAFEHMPWQDTQFQIQGAVHPRLTFAGLPILQMEGMNSGGRIGRLPCAAPEPLEPGPEVVNRDDFIERELNNAFTVDRAELAYYYETTTTDVSPSPVARHPSPVLLQPVWVFSGVSGDGLTRFTAYVQAARADYVADTPPQVGGGVAPDRLIDGVIAEVDGDRLVVEDAQRGRIVLHLNENTRVWKGGWDTPRPIEVGDTFYGYGDLNAEGTGYEMEQLEVNLVNLRGEVLNVTETVAGLDVELDDVHTGKILVHITPATSVTEDGQAVLFAESTFTLRPGDGLHLTGLRLKDGSVEAVQTF